jgi:hypothetical protein
LTSVGDARSALKKVILMQERIDAMRADLTSANADLRALTEKVYAIDKRVIRIETMIEMSGRGPGQPRING